MATLDELDIKITVNSGDSKSEIKSLESEFTKLGGILKQSVKTNSSVTSSFSSISSGIRRFTAFLTSAVHLCGKWFNESNDYVEALNLFRVSMGGAADEAEKFANSVSNLMGIDLKEWMNYQGSFNQILEGFGIADDKAAMMSQQLTQLSYDLSSYANIPVENAFKKIQSGISGQIKGLKEFGLNLSVAQLRETALAHGIELSTAKMTEGQKAMLRYVTLMEKSINIQGDMARTIITPANSMRILTAQMTQLKRALGNIVSVLVVDFIPYVQLAVVWLTELANKIADYFGYELPEIDYTGIESASYWSNDLDDSLSDATDSAKKLKKTLLGFDEINKLNDPTSSATSNLLGGGLPTDLGLDMPTYDFLKGIQLPDFDSVKKPLKEILSYVGAIATGIASWNISKTLLRGLERLKELKSKGFTFNFSILGASKFLGDLKILQEFIYDFLGNGPTWHNVAGMIGEFAGLISDAFLIFGEIKTAGAFAVIQGISEVISAIADMTENGINWDNATLAIRGLSNLAMGISLLKGNFKAAAIFSIVSGLTTVIRELKNVWEAVKSGDWSGVDKVALATGAIQALGGIITAISLLKKVKDKAKVTEAVPALKEISQTTDELSNTVKGVSNSTTSLSNATSSLTTKLSSLVKNLGLGLVALAELAAAAILVVGAVWVVGKELEQVGIAWQPVIENGKNILIAMGLGVVVLASVGLVTGLLGTAGTSLIVSLGLGIVVLAEIGVASALFLGEIWIIGESLNAISVAWSPILNNGETVKSAILIGTSLLIGVGAATAALGVASIASVGLLPFAIAVGTGVLIELGSSFILFIYNLETVANSLSYKLYPSLLLLNAKLPELTRNMKNFTSFMEGFVSQVASYSKSTFIMSFGTTVTNIISSFTKEPISSLANDVNKQYNQAKLLNENLIIANPELKTAIGLIKQYYAFLEELEILTGKSNNISLAKGMFVSMKEVGKNLVTGFVSGIVSQNGFLSNAVKSVLKDSLSVYDGYNYGYEFGRNIAFGISNAIRSSSFPELRSYITSDNNGLSSVKIRAYATGGFPDTSQLFMAREAGPELVGTIGNKSAVVNNDQIVASVEGGVYRGVRDALSENGNTSNGDNRPIYIIIDSKDINNGFVNWHNNQVKVNGRSPLNV